MRHGQSDLVIGSLGGEQLGLEYMSFELGHIPLAGDLLLQALVGLHYSAAAVPRHHLLYLLHPKPKGFGQPLPHNLLCTMYM